MPGMDASERRTTGPATHALRARDGLPPMDATGTTPSVATGKADPPPQPYRPLPPIDHPIEKGIAFRGALGSLTEDVRCATANGLFQADRHLGRPN
ncbi:hypothetical protein AKJ09_00974 [Labilithrix luteola]|uniref:Uncharacterized protein n=1 Tax=Labilithrix luteola TaxID=1391654 RepID=A0A0K1PLB3_9BACT|nr:hypothetical protein AKJ09_00974 [Labilithrix luteola]